MPARRFQVGVRAGLLSAAATAGAMAGFGMRHGDASGPFVMLGGQVQSSLGASGMGATAALLTGVLAHAAWMIAWGLCFAVLAHRRSFVTTVTIAGMLGLLSLLTARSLMPPAMGAVGFAVIPPSQMILSVVLMSAGFTVGRATAGAAVSESRDHAQSL